MCDEMPVLASSRKYDVHCFHLPPRQVGRAVLLKDACRPSSKGSGDRFLSRGMPGFVGLATEYFWPPSGMAVMRQGVLMFQKAPRGPTSSMTSSAKPSRVI